MVYMYIFNEVRKGIHTDFLLGSKKSSMRYGMVYMLIFHKVRNARVRNGGKKWLGYGMTIIQLYH